MKMTNSGFLKIVLCTSALSASILSVSVHAQSVKSGLNQELQNEINSAIGQTPKRKSIRKVKKLKPEISQAMSDEEEALRIQKLRAKRQAEIKNNQDKKEDADIERLLKESKEVQESSYSGTGIDTKQSYSEFTTLKTSKRSSGISLEKKLIGINFYTFYSSSEILGTTNDSLENGLAFTSRNIIPSSLANGAFATSPSYGIGLEFARHALVSNARLGLGFALGTTYEFAREIDRGYIDSVTKRPVQTTNNNPSLSLTTPYLNIVGQYMSSYVFGGLNYAVPQVSNADDEVFQGQLGFQFGGGMAIASWLTLEATYRFINMTVTPTNATNPTLLYPLAAQRKGPGVYEKEDVTLNGFLINAKIRL